MVTILPATVSPDPSRWVRPNAISASPGAIT